VSDRYQHAWLRFSAATNSGPWSTVVLWQRHQVRRLPRQTTRSISATALQTSTIPRRTSPHLEPWTGDNQKARIPPAADLSIPPSASTNSSPTGGAPARRSLRQPVGSSATTGFTKSLWDGAELIVDGGVRQKNTQSGFFGQVPFASPFPSFASTYNDAALQTWSITPRLSVKKLDLRYSFGDPDRHRLLRRDIPSGTRRVSKVCRRSTPMICRNRPWPGTGQHTIRPVAGPPIFPMAPGFRNTSLRARDRYDMNAPFAFDTPGGRRWTATRRNMRCTSVSNTGSTTYFRCSAVRRARSAPPPSMSGFRRDPAFDAFFNPLAQNFKLKTQDLERRRTGLSRQETPVPDADQRLQHGSRNEIHSTPHCSTTSSRSDPPLGVETRCRCV